MISDDPVDAVVVGAGLNLFVAGAGGFVTAAGLNPALTIAALALRSVHRIAGV